MPFMQCKFIDMCDMIYLLWRQRNIDNITTSNKKWGFFCLKANYLINEFLFS